MAEGHEGHHGHPMCANDEARVSPNAGVMQTIGTTMVHIMYGRPSVNDRDIFGGLVPYDEHERALLERRTQTTDNQIDSLVYELYGLTEDEIAIVEEAAS